MALSNPLHGERRPGFVGVAAARRRGSPGRRGGRRGAGGTAGELEIRGPNVFLEYWRRRTRPREPSLAMAGSGPATSRCVEARCATGCSGGISVDIIKTGGFKVSALEIEEVLRAHPCIAECAVVGVADDEWGERVSAAVELRDGATLSLADLQSWAKPRLAPYKIPRDLRPLSALAAQCDGEGHQTRGCRALQITLTSRMPSRPRPPVARDDHRRRGDGPGDRCGRRAAVLPRGWLCGAIRTGAHAGQRIRHLPAGLQTGAEGSVRHRVGD